MASEDGIRSLVPDIVRYAPSWKDGTIERIREMNAAGIRMTHPFLSDLAGTRRRIDPAASPEKPAMRLLKK